MSFRNMDFSYGSVAKFFHWLISVTVILMIIVGASFRYFEPNPTLLMLHKSIGITLLGFMTLRLLWRLTNKTPKMLNSMPQWEKMAMKTGHYFLYLLLFIMPLSGWFMTTAIRQAPHYFWLFIFNMPGVPQNKALAQLGFSTHYYVAWIIGVMIILHVGASIKYIRRML